MRPKRNPKAGEYFLAPLKGEPRDLLMQAVRPGPAGHWYVSYPAHPNRAESYTLLSTCHRCTPSRAKRILGVKENSNG
jgi:hypothetical protein